MTLSTRELACVGAMIFDDGIRARYTGPPDQFTPRGTPGYQHGAARTRVTEPVSVLVSGPQLLVQSPNPHRREPIVAVRWENIDSIKQRQEGPHQCAAVRFSLADGAVLVLETSAGPGSVVIGAILKAIDMISSSKDSMDRYNKLAQNNQPGAAAPENERAAPYDNKVHQMATASSSTPRGGSYRSDGRYTDGLNDSGAAAHLSSHYQQLREKYHVRSDDSSVGDGRKSVTSSRYADDNLADERAIDDIRRKEERIRAEIAESRTRSASRGASASVADPSEADRRRRAAADRARVHRSSSRTSSVGSTALEVFSGGSLNQQKDKLFNNKLQDLASGDAKVRQIQRQMEEDRLKLEAMSAESTPKTRTLAADNYSSSSQSVSHSQMKMENVRSEIEATLAQLEKDGHQSVQAAEAQRRRTGIEKPSVELPVSDEAKPASAVSPPPVPPPRKILAPPPPSKQVPAPLPLPTPSSSKAEDVKISSTTMSSSEGEKRESVSAEPTPLQQLAEATSPAPTNPPPAPVPVNKKVPPPPPAPKTASPATTVPSKIALAPKVPPAAPAAAAPTPASIPQAPSIKKRQFKVHKHGEKFYYVDVESKKTMWSLPDDEPIEIVNPEMLPANQQQKSSEGAPSSATVCATPVMVDEEKLKQIKKELDTVQKNESSTRMQVEDEYRKQSAVKTIEGRESKSTAEKAQNDRVETERKAHKEAERKKQEEAAAARAKADEEAAVLKAQAEKAATEKALAEKKKQEEEKAAREAAAKAEVAAAEAAEKLKKFNDPKRPLRTSGSWVEKRTADNKIYFANSTTKGSTWKIEETPFDKMELTEGISAANSADAEKKRFIEKKSPEGKIYYIDVETKQSVWKLPEGAEVVDPTSLSNPASPTRGTASPTKSEAGGGGDPPTEPGKKFLEKKSPDGKTYYVDMFTKQSVWKLPEGAEVVDPSSVSSPASPARLTPVMEPGKKFIEKKSPDGKTYYIDAATKQSVWKLPEGAEIVDGSSLPASPQRAASPAVTSSGPRFLEKKSPDGKTYYINMATKQSVWKLPERAVVVSADQAASPSPPRSTGSKPRFFAKQAPDGRTYYINAATKQSVWQKPEDAEIVSSP